MPKTLIGSARAIAWTLAIVLPLAVIGEAAASALDARRYPPPGELVPLSDGRTLHMDAAVRGVGGPTIVLEAGAGIPSSLWQSTITALMTAADGPLSVVAYDRPGSAWGGPVGLGPMPDEVVADLREALNARGLAAPYLLVGHSIGSHYARSFVAAYPDDVVGLVLVDPRPEDAARGNPELEAAQARATRMLRWGVRLRPLGIPRLVHRRSDLLPGDVAREVRALELHRDHLRGGLALGEALGEIDAFVAHHASDLSDTPVRILSAGHALDASSIGPATHDMDRLHRQMTRISTRATRHVIADADHLSIVTEPDFAGEIVRHVLDLAGPDRPTRN